MLRSPCGIIAACFRTHTIVLFLGPAASRAAASTARIDMLIDMPSSMPVSAQRSCPSLCVLRGHSV